MNWTNDLINNRAKIISDPSTFSLFRKNFDKDNRSNDNRLKIIIKMEIC